MISEQQHRKQMLDGILGTKQEKDLVNLCKIPVTLSVIWQSYMSIYQPGNFKPYCLENPA